jgi:tetratricopeptide (TPR) repeat protein
MFQGNYQKCQMYHRNYLDASVATGSEQGILDAHISLSGVYISLRDYVSAEHHAESALALARPLGKWRLLPPSLFSLAHAQKWQGKYETACNHYEEGIRVARDVGTAPSNIANGLYGLAQTRYLQGNYSAALEHFEDALEIARSARLVFRVCQISHDMVFAYVSLDQMEAARDRLKEALRSAQQLNTPQFMSKALAAAIIVWQHLGYVEQAAVWASLLSSYTHLLHPSLFDSGVYKQLEAELGVECYRDAMERGKTLNLENIVSEILTLLN